VVKMEIPVEIKYISKHMNPKIRYECPDCHIEMKRENRTHSPLAVCFHSICPKCGLEFCDYYSAYWGKRPKNPNVYREVEI